MTQNGPTNSDQAADPLGCPREDLPKSVAIIMDGNGRWAQQRGLPRSAGHEQGALRVRPIVTAATRLGLEALTLYSFSIENWNRPADEIEILMHLYAEYLRRERSTIMDHDLRLRHLGRREGLPNMVLDQLDDIEAASAGNKGMFLCLALNYGSRTEIVDGVRRIARRAADGDLDPDTIDETVIADSLDTTGVPDPDLLIRTSGEMRLSNFLLWQLSYAEFFVTDVYWPDFDVPQFHRALRTYAQRDRRYGGLGSAAAEGSARP